MTAGLIQQHLAEANRAMQSGAVDRAREHLDAVLAIDSDQPAARNWLGLEALDRNDARSAIEHFQIACRSDPKAQPLWMNLARAHRELGDPKSERDALEQVLTIDQRDLLALIRLAELHERLGEEAQAARRWGAVIALSSGLPDRSPEFDQLLDRAKTYVQAQQSKLGDAIEVRLAEDLSGATARDRRRMQGAADHWLGKRPIYANQCEGLHYPFLPADEFFDRDHFPWLEQLEAATPTILDELKAILGDPGPGLEPYISMAPGTPGSKWSPLDKSLDWGAFHLWKEGRRIDENCARAPRTSELVEALPLCRIEGRAPAIFFSILKAKSHIPAHTGVTNVRSIVHLGLIVPQSCGFRVGGETREWRVGEAFVFDDTIEHEAWNGSKEDRAVLIIDTWNPHLSGHEREMICRFYEAADQQRGVRP
ncbi:MAG TPA: aspartyl/asparaginyl beta-hydroxylase domain-containing protein [Sphingomicrobium sp.]|nr:aspartyl/asparaginyl beta-hydroxylase domain-containing protein [Sphingomicrobium sp.]